VQRETTLQRSHIHQSQSSSTTHAPSELLCQRMNSQIMPYPIPCMAARHSIAI